MFAYDIIATIDLLPTLEGGREVPTEPIQMGYIFVFDNAMYSCHLMLGGMPPIKPGEKATVPIKFLDPEVKSLLKVGDKFELQDYRTIATGIVAEKCSGP